MAIGNLIKKVLPVVAGLVVIVLLVSSIYLVGYRRGYAVCTKDKKPEIVAQPGSTVNSYTSDPKDVPHFVGFKIMKVGLGLMIEKK